MKRGLNGALLGAVIAAAALLLAAGAGAAGRPPVRNHNITPNVTCGETLSTSTVLSADLDCSGYPGFAVIVNKGVKFDLGGHTLKAQSGHNAVVFYGSNSTVTNGTITDGSNGVFAETVSGVTVSKLTISNESAYDIDMEYTGKSTVSGNTLNGVNGILSEYGMGNTITGNTVTGNGSSYGIKIYREQADSISKNGVTLPVGVGTAIYDFESYGNVFTGNTTTGGQYGIELYENDYGPVTAIGNTAQNASADGFYFYDNYFGQYGPVFPHSIYMTNKAMNNGADGFYSYYDVGSAWTGNIASGNSQYGFELVYPTDYTMKANQAMNNTWAGFYFESNGPYYNPTLFSGNNATGNQDYGYYADYFLILGAGNKAKNNLPYDCYATTCPAGATFGLGGNH